MTPVYENADGPAGGGPVNELELELLLKRVTLRDFSFRLEPLWLGAEVTGLELEATAHDTGLKVSLRFERGEFVNVATAGLAFLDAADAATETQGGGDTQ